ncbi:MAG TPA: hypothetical protein VM791_06970 [Vicinamibacterales bacterium]|nr:hypothetical protein [Vicinamibacterales bacterium]
MASPTAARTAARARAAARGDKNMIVQRIEQVGLALSARLRQPTVERHLLEALENARERRTLGERPPQHLDHLRDCLGAASVSPAGRPWPMRKPTCRTMQ